MCEDRRCRSNHRQCELARTATCLAGSHDSPTYQVMGIVGVWLTFESNGWHVDSCLGNGRDFGEGE